MIEEEIDRIAKRSALASLNASNVLHLILIDDFNVWFKRQNRYRTSHGYHMRMWFNQIRSLKLCLIRLRFMIEDWNHLMSTANTSCKMNLRELASGKVDFLWKKSSAHRKSVRYHNKIRFWIAIWEKLNNPHHQLCICNSFTLFHQEHKRRCCCCFHITTCFRPSNSIMLQRHLICLRKKLLKGQNTASYKRSSEGMRILIRLVSCDWNSQASMNNVT